MASLKESVNFDLIRYANCWEDAEVLLEALDIQPNSRVLSIASAGDNSFSLLGEGADLVCAVDLSLPQLYLTELKRAAFGELTYSDLLTFLGFLGGEQLPKRWNLYQAIRPKLQPSTRTYWDAYRKQIEAGVISQGKFEKYFGFFSRKIMPLIHSKRTIGKLLQPKSSTEQISFYHRNWNTWRWRLFFRVFFGRTIMGRFGRDPEFLRQVEVPVHAFIFQQAENHLRRVAATQNPMLERILTGSYGDKLPHYVRPRTHAEIVRNLDALEIREGYANEIAQAEGGFDRFNLSNIFEYMAPDDFATVSHAFLTSAEAGARFAYWNLMAPRD
ncbi:MAG: DUF3419 family protein, partial [Bacteroidota bacterium]